MENSQLKVTDRRRFSPDGTPLGDLAPKNATDSKGEEVPPAQNPESPGTGWEREIPADFSSLILSLAAAAQSALGKDRHQAKYHIDLLGVLTEKTKGNLAPEEEKLLQALLYDLRMRFVQANVGGPSVS